MTAKKKDHWSTLASILGMGGSREPEQETPEPTPQEETVAATIPSPVELPPPVIVEPPPVAPVVEKVAPVAPAPAAPPAPKRRDHWGSLLGQLGLGSVEPEPVAPPPPPVPAPVAKASKPRDLVRRIPSAPPVVAAPPVAETPVAKLPLQPVSKVETISEEETPEGPPGYQGPDLMQRLQAEREAERQKIANQKSNFDTLFRAGATRHTRDDEVNYDDDLNSGLKALWADHETQDSTKREQPKREEPSQREPSQREPSRRETSRRDEPRRDEPRREEPNRVEPRRDDIRGESARREPRREQPRREELRREPLRREEPRREEPQREEVARNVEDIEEDRIEGAELEHVEGLPPGEEQPRKRRRRRRGRGRGSRDTAETSAGSANASPQDVAANEEDVLDFLPAGDDLHSPDSAAINELESGEDRGRDEEGRPPRKRRRRRRRPDDADAAKTPAPPRAKVASPADIEDDFDDDEAGPASLDYGDDPDDEGHKGIPTWDDAVGSIVAANMEARNRSGYNPARNRDGGGRGRGGRR